MKAHAYALRIALILIVVGVPLVLVSAQRRKPNPPPAANSNFRLSGPYTHENLSIFLVHGKDTISNRNILTLQEALEQKKVIVHETQDVNELAIENVSTTHDVFVQSGDIVKGGQQDRVLAVDLIVPPRSGKIPIAAFCVESGRWSKRGSEESANFAASTDMIATNGLKVAANSKKSQEEVWKEVEKAQAQLSSNVGVEVSVAQSASSLQLSLEHGKVKDTTDKYMKSLAKIIDTKTDVIGYAIAINGKISGADIYASTALFKKLWPKLLKASAVEAVAELKAGTKFDKAEEKDVRGFFSSAEDGKASESAVNSRTKVVTKENDVSLLLESRDVAQKDGWVHRSYIKK